MRWRNQCPLSILLWVLWKFLENWLIWMPWHVLQQAINSFLYTSLLWLFINCKIAWFYVLLYVIKRRLFVFLRFCFFLLLDQLHGFRLYLSSINQFTENNIVYNNTDYDGGTIVITQDFVGLFQFVKLDLPGTFRAHFNKSSKNTGPLALCEVEVFVKSKFFLIFFHCIVT